MPTLHRRPRMVSLWLAAFALTAGCAAHSPPRTATAASPASPAPMPATASAEAARAPDVSKSADIKPLEQAAKARPNDAKAQARYGSALVEAGKAGKGISLLRRAVTLDPKMAAAWHNLALAAGQNGQLDIAADAYAHVVAALPDHAGEWIKFGYVLIQLGRYGEAERAFHRAAGLEPNASEPLVALAASYFADFHYAQAIADLKRAVVLNPRSDAAQANLAAIYLELGKRAEAVAAIRNAIAYERTPQHYLVLGRILADSPQPEERQSAKNALDSALTLGRADGPTPLDAAGEAEANHLLGVLAQSEGKREEAIADWRRALALDPTRPDTMQALGRALVIRGGPDTGEGRKLLQEYQQAQTRRDKTRALQQRVEEHPNDGTARLLYGKLLLEQNSLPRAVWELKEAVRLRPQDTAARRALAEALRRQGRRDEFEPGL